MDLNEFLIFLEVAQQMHLQTCANLNLLFYNINYQFEYVFRWFTNQATNQFLRGAYSFGNVPLEFRREIIDLLSQLAQDRITVEQLLDQIDLMNDNGNGQIEEIFEVEEDFYDLNEMDPGLASDTADDYAISNPNTVNVTTTKVVDYSKEPLFSIPSLDRVETELQQNDDTDPNIYNENDLISDESGINNNIENIVSSEQSALSYRCNWTACGRSFPKKASLITHRRKHSYVSVKPKKKRTSLRLSCGTKKCHKQSPTWKPFYCKWPHCQMTSKRKYNVIRHIQTQHYKLSGELSSKERTILDKGEHLNYLGFRVEPI